MPDSLVDLAVIIAAIWALIAISDRFKLVERARRRWGRLYYWYHRERVPTICRLCHKEGERRLHLQLSEWEVVSGWGWEYYLARGRKVVRGATGRRYGLIPPFHAEIEHFSCKARRRISDSGVTNLLRKTRHATRAWLR